MINYISYDWIVNYKYQFRDMDWIIDDVLKVNGEIRYRYYGRLQPYSVYRFIVKLPSKDVINEFKSNTSSYFNIQNWVEATEIEFDNAKDHVKFLQLPGDRGFRRIDSMVMSTRRNRRNKKVNIIKSIIRLDFKQAYNDWMWLIETKESKD